MLFFDTSHYQKSKTKTDNGAKDRIDNLMFDANLLRIFSSVSRETYYLVLRTH